MTRREIKQRQKLVDQRTDKCKDGIRTNHGATVFEGKGEYSGKTHKLVYTVVSSDESGKLEREIRATDGNAFINVLASKEIVGRFFKRAND